MGGGFRVDLCELDHVCGADRNYNRNSLSFSKDKNAGIEGSWVWCVKKSHIKINRKGNHEHFCEQCQYETPFT